MSAAEVPFNSFWPDLGVRWLGEPTFSQDYLICCGARRSSKVLVKAPSWAHFFEERNAMILGMNSRELRLKREWSVHLWPTRRHWALVLQPAGRPFTARVVDDFIHNATHCYNAEVCSDRFFLVYELLVDRGEPFLTVSVKTDFEPERAQVQHLGNVGPWLFEEIGVMAASIVLRYRAYSIVGCNCQHFASEFALSLGASALQSIVPDDEAFVHTASDGAALVSAAGITVAGAAAAAAAGTAIASTAVPAAAFAVPPLAAAPPVLFTVAAGAGAIGILSGFTLIFIGTGYRLIHHHYRDSPDLTEWKKKSGRKELCHDSGSTASSSEVLLLVKTSAIMQADEIEEEEAVIEEPEPEAEIGQSILMLF